MPTMEYNKLKKMVLGILSDGEWQVSKDIFVQVRHSDYGLNLNALRMALMRYYKQGILERRRHLGAYEYRISDRGLARLAWLTSIEKSSEGVDNEV